MIKSKLSISAYDENEEVAKRRFGNDILWAFTPVTFSSLGYPAKVEQESELVRYLDSMKEAISRHVGSEDTFLRQYSLRTRFSKAERTLMEKLRTDAADVGEACSQSRQLPINSVISAIGLFRVVMQIKACFPDRNLRILEIGPGGGFLGALLLGQGFEYVAVDNTQGFYLWQSRFFQHIAGDDFVETAHLPVGEQPDFSGKAVHIPWWHYVPEPEEVKLTADIVISDQALCEMHGFAMRYSVHKAFDALKDSPVGLFLFSGPGHTYSSFDSLNHAIAEFGFHGVLTNQVYAYSAGPRQYATKFYEMDTEIPVFGGEPEFSAPEVLKTKPAELPWDYRFREYIGLWPAASEFID